MNIGRWLFIIDGTAIVQLILIYLQVTLKYCKKFYFYQAAFFQVILLNIYLS